MSLNSKGVGGGTYTPIPAGSHAAYCFSLVDLGTQDGTYMGKPKIQPKVRIGFEVPAETVEVEGKDVPMTIYQDYTNMLVEKATLRHHLESWRGVAFTTKELECFQLPALIGKPCIISVLHKTSKAGNLYAQITSIGRLTKGMILPPMHHTPVIYDVEQGKDKTFDALPDFLKEKIALCHEWTQPDNAPADEQHDDDEPIDGDEPEDNIPF